MKMTKGQLHAIGFGMKDYHELVEKDKDVKVTEERMLKLDSSLKWTLLYNWQKVEKHFQNLMTTISDEFRKSGGQILPSGYMTYMDTKKVAEVKKKYAKNQTKLSTELEKLREEAEKKQTAHDDWLIKELGKPFDKVKLRAIKPSLEDIKLLPESLVMAYMHLSLCHEPTEDEDTDDKQNKEEAA